jgi:RecJ-like exonuclease
MPDAVVIVAEVKGLRTKSGNTRFVLRDEEGREYTTFREEIARYALIAEGRRARVTFHEQQRGGYTNVYLDSVEVLEDEEASEERREPVEEVAWKTAVDAAPWLLGGEPEEPVPPDELFERLQPFKDRVAEDIKD